MIKTLFISILFCLHLSLRCQQVRLITVDKLTDRINKGKDTTFVINFWATSCAPCTRELPFFEKLNQEFKKKKLKVLLISVDFKSELSSSVRPFVKRKSLKSEVFLLDEENEQEYIERIDTSWSGSIPATLFIKKRQREFFERDITYSELLEEYKLLN